MSSPLRTSFNDDVDPYGPIIVEDLLNGLNEWHNTQGIVRLTFKALSDVIRSQGSAIQELERQMIMKVNKSEVNSALTTKANVTDVQRSFSEVCTALEAKVNLEEIQELLEDKVTRTDMQIFLSQKMDDLRGGIIRKENYHHDYALKSRNSYDERANLSKIEEELQKLYELLDLKANTLEVNEALSNKANKQSVATALHRKASREELEQILASKADIQQLKEIIDILDQKADMIVVERLAKDLSTKANRSDSRQDFNRDNLSDLHMDIESKLNHKFKEFQDQFTQLRESLGSTSSYSTKVDSLNYGRVLEMLSKKADITSLQELQDQIQHGAFYDTKEFERAVTRSIQRGDGGFIEDQVNEALSHKLDRVYKQVNEAVEQVKFSSLGQSSDQWEQSKHLRIDIDALNRQLQGLQTQLIDLKGSKADRNDLYQTNKQIDNFLRTSNIDDTIALLQTEQKKALSSLKSEIRDQIMTHDREVRRAVGGRTDQELVVMVRELRDQVNSKASHYDIEAMVRSNKDQLETIGKELLMKANIKDICTLLDTKANAEDLNRGIAELNSALHQKANVDELQAFSADQSVINEALCAENCVGRWLWKSGRCSAGSFVPWEIQSVNTCPDNFI